MGGVERFDVIVVGSGFAGSILARALSRQGRSVLLVERGCHPRFALGESSTPLGNLCLERLAATWDLPDLHQLAAYGRWTESHPGLRRGLKRGFTFYRHRVGEPFRNSVRNENRLLVAASPSDRTADSHWLREDVDHHLVRRAVESGVAYRDLSEIRELEIDDRVVRIAGERQGRAFRAKAALLVDGSGGGAFLADRLGLAASPTGFSTRLVYGHFAEVESFVQEVEAAGERMPAGPYPDERAAVHHILDGGWMYVLPFDHGVVSAGFLIREDRPGRLDEVSRGLSPAESWSAMIGLYPSLGAQFERARPVRPIAQLQRIPRRVRPASGARWALLPHTFSFLDPIFSTGIAWSLQGVERLAEALSAWSPSDPRESEVLAAALDGYGAALERESRQLGRLIDGAYLAMASFDLLVTYSFLYFAAVSFLEARLRLAGPQAGRRRATREGFLGAGDPAMEALFTEAVDRLRRRAASGSPVGAAEEEEFAAWVRAAIAPWNVAGLAEPAVRNLYPVDLDLLVERADLLGLDSDQVRRALPSLRGS